MGVTNGSPYLKSLKSITSVMKKNQNTEVVITAQESDIKEIGRQLKPEKKQYDQQPVDCACMAVRFSNNLQECWKDLRWNQKSMLNG